jgi:hypothetical protein
VKTRIKNNLIYKSNKNLFKKINIFHKEMYKGHKDLIKSLHNKSLDKSKNKNFLLCLKKTLLHKINMTELLMLYKLNRLSHIGYIINLFNWNKNLVNIIVHINLNFIKKNLKYKINNYWAKLYMFDTPLYKEYTTREKNAL